MLLLTLSGAFQKVVRLNIIFLLLAYIWGNITSIHYVINKFINIIYFNKLLSCEILKGHNYNYHLSIR